MNELFGVYHIVALCVSILIIIGMVILFKKISLEKIITVMFYIGIVSEVIKVFSYILVNEDVLGGYLPKTDLPFHLCSIQIIFLFILKMTKNEKIRKLLFGFMMPTCLIGAFAALILPTSSARNMPVITVQFFGYHSALVAYAITLLFSKKVIFDFKDYLNCLKFLFVIGMGAIYINSILYDGVSNINFMYVVNPPEDNLPYLNKDNGWLSYIIRYALLAVLCVSMCYIKPIILKIKELKNKKIISEKQE